MVVVRVTDEDDHVRIARKKRAIDMALRDAALAGLLGFRIVENKQRVAQLHGEAAMAKVGNP